jgi:hypothetical protein
VSETAAGGWELYQDFRMAQLESFQSANLFIPFPTLKAGDVVNSLHINGALVENTFSEFTAVDISLAERDALTDTFTLIHTIPTISEQGGTLLLDSSNTSILVNKTISEEKCYVLKINGSASSDGLAAVYNAVFNVTYA